jgi:transcriptional regulator with XRE-family HTH domain
VGSQIQLGKNIKKARKKADLTQAEVAEKAEIHVNYFARIERGEENHRLSRRRACPRQSESRKR